MSWRRCAVLLAWLALGPFAAQAQLSVETELGPLTLPEEVEAALAAWQTAFEDEMLEEPNATFAFAPDLLGPDTASLTLLWSDRRAEVLLAPSRYRTPPVLLHEIGVLLGVPVAAEGVMDPLLAGQGTTAPTAADIALLRDARTYPLGDVTRDGSIDFYDLAAIGAAFGSVGVNLAADLNGDGVVDAEDLAALREVYTFGEPQRPSAGAPPAVPPSEDAPEDAPEEPPDDAPAAPVDDAAEPEN